MTVACVLKSGGVELSRLLGAVPMLPGVYEIVHDATGRRYVGSAQNIRKRWRSHLSCLEGRSRVRGNPKLKNAWQKDGAAAFSFAVLVFCENDQLLRVEEALIRFRQAAGPRGFNCRATPGSNAGLRLPKSEETKRKIGRANAIALRGKPSPMKGRAHNLRSRAAMSATKRAKGRKIAFAGESLCLSDWADRLGMDCNALRNRLVRGWPLERALTEKSRGY